MPKLDPTTAQFLLALQADDVVESFLGRWEHFMGLAGYLEHTTAKREDCIHSYRGFLQPVWEDACAGTAQGFGELLTNTDGWADPVLQMARRHRTRGITSEMFIGCFQTLLHAIEELLEGLLEPDHTPVHHAAVRRAAQVVRERGDALITLLVAEWTAAAHTDASPQRDLLDQLDATNRQLTLQKNKYENILASTTDLILVVDEHGHITEANEAARVFLDEERFDAPVWDLLNLPATSMGALIAHHPHGTGHEIRLYDGDIFMELNIRPLSAVSLASTGHLFLLTNITGHVRQRELLEEQVRQRTEQLEAEKARLEEMNITLRNVMGSIERDRCELQQAIAATVEDELLPALGKLRRADSPQVRKGYLDLLEDHLSRLHGGTETTDQLQAHLLKLTPTELRVCQFIQAGSGTKDIAESLSLSAATVQTHRRNIRKKLGLQNTSVNLYTFLRSAPTT